MVRSVKFFISLWFKPFACYLDRNKLQRKPQITIIHLLTMNTSNSSFMWTTVGRTKDNEIFAVIYQLKQLKRRPENNSVQFSESWTATFYNRKPLYLVLYGIVVLGSVEMQRIQVVARLNFLLRQLATLKWQKGSTLIMLSTNVWHKLLFLENDKTT